jgi:hypothetical protein
VILPDATPAHDQEIGVPPDEVARDRFFDLYSIEGLWVEFPVEPFLGHVVSETGVADATLHGTLSPRAGFDYSGYIEEIRISEKSPLLL